MAEAWIATHQPKFEAGELANFAFVLRDSGELVGPIGMAIERRFDRAELGYWIGKPYWVRDIAPRPVKRCCFRVR